MCALVCVGVCACWLCACALKITICEHRCNNCLFQNKQNLEGKEGTKACASLSSETDSGVNMNIDEMDCTLPTTEDCTEGTIHSSENVICFNE